MCPWAASSKGVAHSFTDRERTRHCWLPGSCHQLTAGLLSPSLTTVHLQFRKPNKVKSLSRVWLFVTPWTVAHQAPPSMGFPKQEYWNGLPFPSPGDLPHPGIEPGFPTLQAYALTSEPPGKPIIGLVLRCNTKKPVWSLEVFFILFWMVVTWTYS